MTKLNKSPKLKKAVTDAEKKLEKKPESKKRQNALKKAQKALNDYQAKLKKEVSIQPVQPTVEPILAVLPANFAKALIDLTTTQTVNAIKKELPNVPRLSEEQALANLLSLFPNTEE